MMFLLEHKLMSYGELEGTFTDFVGFNQTNIQCDDAFEAEARAYLLGLQSIHEQCTQSMQSDNEGVIDAIQKHNQTMSSKWKLFDDSKVLSLGLHRFVVEFVTYASEMDGVLSARRVELKSPRIVVL